MKISIITATYNSVSTLKNTLNSLHSQKFKNFEHIIIDGGSSDGTIDLIKNNKNNFTTFISEPDNGIYDALNKGISLAKGQIIGFLHSDDILSNNNILTQINNSFNENKIDGVYGDLQYISNKANTIRKWKSCEFTYDLLKKGWMPPHPTLFLSKDVYEKCGKFDLNYKISSDYDIILRVFKNRNFKFRYIPIVITKMTIGGESNKTLKNILNKSIEDYNIISKHNIGGIYTLFLKNISKLKQFLTL